MNRQTSTFSRPVPAWRDAKVALVAVLTFGAAG
jgi:hypothetical protein